MGGTSQTLTVADLVEINQQMVIVFGGFNPSQDDNLLNRASLEYTLEMMHGSYFGQSLFPTIPEKAAFLAYRIIQGHVFRDGNKRTGMMACYVFLKLNGCNMIIGEPLIEVAVKIAKGDITFEEFVEWLREHIVYNP